MLDSEALELLKQLQAIELIKQVQACYFRNLDVGNVDVLKTFMDDCRIDFSSPTYEIHLNGWAEAEEFFSRT